MKNIIVIIAMVCLTSCVSNAQTAWTPNKNVKTTIATNSDKTQCWATTVKGERCKYTGYPERSGVMGSDGHWYCFKHINQAPQGKISKK